MTVDGIALYDGLLPIGGTVPQYTIFQFIVNFMSTKQIQKSDDLFDLSEVSAYFGISESTIRRKVRKSRENGGGFILPLFSQGSRLLWRKEDIVNFRGEDVETIDFDPSQVPSLSQAPPIPSSAQVRRGLEKHGIKLPPVGSNPSN